MNVSGCQGRNRMTATLSQGQGIWLFIAPVFPLSTGDNPFILRIRRSPLAPRFRHQSIITLLMLFRSTTFKSPRSRARVRPSWLVDRDLDKGRTAPEPRDLYSSAK